MGIVQYQRAACPLLDPFETNDIVRALLELPGTAATGSKMVFAIHWHLHRPTCIGVVQGASTLHSGTVGYDLTAASDITCLPHWVNSHTLGQFKGQAVAYKRACDAANPVSGGLCSNTVPLCIASTA